MTDFYVYLHRRLSDNSVFYVGKGRGRRAFRGDSSSRSAQWSNTARKHGWTVEILFSDLAEDEAYQLEIDTILEMRYFNQPLVNHNEGGYGGKPPVFTANIRDRISKKVKEHYVDKHGPNFGKNGKKFWENGRASETAWLNLDLFYKYYSELGVKDRTLSRVFPEVSRTVFIKVCEYFDTVGDPLKDRSWVQYSAQRKKPKLTEKVFLCKPKFSCEKAFENIDQITDMVKSGLGNKAISKFYNLSDGSISTILRMIKDGYDYKEDRYVTFMLRRHKEIAKAEYLENDE